LFSVKPYTALIMFLNASKEAFSCIL